MTVSFAIEQQFSELKYVPGFRGIAEILVVPLVDKPGDMFLLFRGPRPRNANRKILGGNGSQLASHEYDGWTERQVAAATVLRLVPAGFIQAWVEGDGLPIGRMADLLLSNLPHDIRTPLNAIVNYLELALEGPIDLEARKELSETRTAIEALISASRNLSQAFSTRLAAGQSACDDMWH